MTKKKDYRWSFNIYMKMFYKMFMYKIEYLETQMPYDDGLIVIFDE